MRKTVRLNGSIVPALAATLPGSVTLMGCIGQRAQLSAMKAFHWNRGSALAAALLSVVSALARALWKSR